MKKLFITALIAVAIGASAFANPSTVSTKVQNNFRIDFKSAESVTWKMGDSFVKATFILDEKEYTAFYNFDGDLIGYSKKFAFDKLPKNALETVAKKYPFPPNKLTECIEYTNADGERNYFISFERSSQILVVEVSLSGDVSEYKNLQK